MDFSSLATQIEALQTMQRVSAELSAELDIDRLLHKILRAAVHVMNCLAGSLLLYDAASGELVFQVVDGGGGDELEGRRIKSDQGVVGAAFSGGEAIIVDDASSDNRYFADVANGFGLKVSTLIAVPLKAKGEAIGVLEVMNKASGGKFTADDCTLLQAFASQSAVAIENARLYRSVIEDRDRILGVEAGVRQELVRDLHDGPAQILSAIILSVRLLRETMQRAPERTDTELLQLEALAQKALYQVRNMLFDLRPVILETRGLGPALEAYVERLRLVESFKISLVARSIPSRLKPSVEAIIFSIIQEAVNNAKKHASPKNVDIRAEERDGYLLFRVEDDGRGFDPSRIEHDYAERNSFGILNMRERAEIVRGRLEIESQPGRGTTVVLRVPIDQDTDHRWIKP